MKIVIIEDESKTAADLEQTLCRLAPESEILCTLESVNDAVIYFSSNPAPDLIFMDIQLSDGLSFTIFEKVQITCPVIFCTAYDEYAINAFKVNGVGFILKPFDSKAIQQSLDKIHLLKNHFQQVENYQSIVNAVLSSLQPAVKSSFLATYKGKLIPVSTTDIAYFCIENEGIYLHTFDNRHYLLDHSLEEIETMTGNRCFFRVNRQFLISFDAIKEIEPYFNRKLVVKLSVDCNSQILVGKLKITEFRNWLSNR